MNAPLLIPADIGEAQRQASDPLASAWVSANAGSGKTTVLTQRVIRLLLGETDPGRILCLTFTKAAAAHMANKVFGSLSRWAVLPDEDLAQAIETYEGRSSPQRRRDGARRLFARALETPGGLKVQTIHAFCERLLHQFPFEANVAAAFQVLEDRSAEELLAAIKADVLTQAAAEPRSRLGRALGAIVALAAEATFGELVNEAIGRRHAIADWLSGSTSLDKALARLRAAMGLRDGECCGTIEAQILASPHFDQALWRSAAEAMLASSAQDQDQGRRVRAWLEAQERRRLDAYLSIFLTLDGKPRARLLTKSLAARQELVAQRLADEQNRLLGLLERRKAAVLAEATDALLVIADAIITRYERAKRSRGLLDYDDLIVRAERLLSQGEAAWVLYKLDGGIDHILIDEAQDTNPGQWRVIEALTEEFFAGQGARDEIRTVFAVGDEKQSIFSFQGAEPARFEAMRRHFGDKAQGAQLAFRDVKLRYSFRSTQDILTAVDRVFADPAARQGLSTDGDYREHLAVRHDGPGVVEMWPVFSPVRDGDDAVAWDAPFDVVSETSPAALLAGRVARTIRGWLDRGECLAAKAKPVRAGEILILVRSRNAVFEALIRALKTAQVPVAGADRLVLTEHIAVLDLMALAEFVLLPEDDLTLATLLKSPLIGLDEDALFALCRGRRGTLWRALQEKSAFDPRFRDAYDRLSDWRRRADFVRPYEFFATVLGADEGRRRIYARLGHEAADALDELLNLALAYEAAGTPSLQGFLAWLKAARVEVKRDLDLVRDEVRVMTVHNAKGLEADVVFLADCCTAPEGRHDPRLLPLAAEDGISPLVWRGRREEDPACVAAARERHRAAEMAEHRRLLYVAMTRARDRLYVCGVQGKRERPDGNWYDMIRNGLEPDLVTVAGPDGEPTAWRWSLNGADAAAPSAGRAGGAAMETDLPSWLRMPAKRERAPRPLAPSSALEAIEAGGRLRARDRLDALADPANAAALRRGQFVHRLLQALPELAPEARREAAGRYLERQAGDLAEADRAALLDEVMGVLEHEAFAPVFAPGSRAEAPIAGRILIRDELVPVAGQVDRLAVTPEAVFIVDFKTNREPPLDLEEVPAAYVAQLAAYRAVLRGLYPERRVHAALLWTATPALMPLPERLLERALRV